MDVFTLALEMKIAMEPAARCRLENTGKAPPLVPPGEEAPPVPIRRGGLALVCGGGESSGKATGNLIRVK